MTHPVMANDNLATPLRLAPPAKINLHLRVGPPTPDGFHPLLSWMVTAALFDNLEFVPTDRPGVSLLCDDPSIPCDGSNLIVKTASALLETVAASKETRRIVPGLQAALQKRIPVGAGLGGGSSDGAFALLGLNHFLGLNWPPQRLSDFAARFGSDLSFFFHGPSSICTGRGQIVSPTSPPKPRYALLILPKIHMPTPAVYRKFDEMHLGQADSLAPQNWQHWSTLSANELLPLLVNDLEPPAFALNPTLAALHARSIQLLERAVRMSGSGSTLFTLYDEEDLARQAAQVIRTQLKTRVEAIQICAPLPDFSASSAPLR
jgi:4-diphosphocytidyl-2-C-methyl-D-erythritol kinase